MRRPSSYRLTRELLLNDLAIRSFRDIADQDYVAARLAYHHKLPEPSLWQSQQALEKYLKCILLLHRIPATDIGHSLSKAVERIQESQSLPLDLSLATRSFIGHLEMYGAERYLTTSSVAFGHDVVSLDRAVWELRRFCTLDLGPRKLKLQAGKRAHRYSLDGWLEGVLAKDGETRLALIRENAFWGPSRRTLVKVPGWISCSNAPLWMHPEILSLVTKYIRIPKELATAFKAHRAPDLHVPEDGIEMDLTPLKRIGRKSARRKR
jgi:HEPN domain-containing protein